MKNSFVLYTSYQEQLSLLTMVQRGVLFTAILAYASGDDLPEMDGITNMAFAFIKADIDRDAEKYERTCEARRESGLKGGRPKNKALCTVNGREVPKTGISGYHFLYFLHDNYENQYKIGETQNLYKRIYEIRRPTEHIDVVDFYIGSAAECRQLEKDVLHEYAEYSIGGDWFEFPEEVANEIVKKYFSEKPNGYYENQMVFKKPDNDNEYDNDLKEITSKEVTKKRFQKPSLEDVQEYVTQQGYSVDAARFIDFYESKGWMIGKTPMKDWKAAVRSWSRSQRPETTAKANGFTIMNGRDFDWDDFGRVADGI